MILTTILFCTLSSIISFLLWLHKRNQFFVGKNVKYSKPYLLFGNALQSSLRRKHPMEELDAAYNLYPGEDMFGFFQLVNPMYVLRNPEYVERVLVKDFAHFYDRLKTDGEIYSPADANLFLMCGNTWRAIRSKFSPLFTSGKLKFMYHSMTNCGTMLERVLNEKHEQAVDMAEMMSRFASDVIGSAAFGVEVNSLQATDSKFREMSRKLLEPTVFQNIKVLLFVVLPKVAKFLNIRGLFDINVANYFFDIISNSMKHRKEGGFVRNDFVQMLLQLKEKGKIEVQIHDSADNYLMMDKVEETFEVEMTDDILVGGAFSFLTAGFHASAMALTFTLVDLAQNPPVVEKLREEIRTSVRGEVPTYDELKSMSYCEKVIKESLRMHPTAPALSRVCTKEYTFPNGIKVERGTTVFVPISAIHMDPEYWPEPDVYNPDRFHLDCPPKPGTYLPFGDGPRICIAMRFAMLEMKFALVYLIKKYDFQLCEETKLPLKLDPKVFLLTPQGGVRFKVKKLGTN